MDWTQAFTIIGILGVFMFFMLQRIEKDIEKIDKRMEGVERRLDGHATRIDQLYRMFCELQSEVKEIYKDWNRERK